MITFISILHLLFAVVLITLILLQNTKGAMGAFGSGGSKTLLGSTGTSHFIIKATWTLAILFSITSISLAYLSSKGGQSSVVDSLPVAPQQTLSTPADPLPSTQSEPSSESQIKEEKVTTPDSSKEVKTPSETQN